MMPVRAPLRDMTPLMLSALCMLAGGSMVWHHEGYMDVAGTYHLPHTIGALERRGLAEYYTGRKYSRVRLTDPLGRWFASTALARAAELLVAAQSRDTERRAARFMNPVVVQP